MKKTILLTICGFLLASQAGFAQQGNEQTTPTYSHWSFGLKGGVDRAQFATGSITGSDGYGFTGGLDIEWLANPMWGLSLDYSYLAYSHSKNHGHSNEISILGNVNLANLLHQYRKGNWQKLNVYARLGGGIALMYGDQSKKTFVIPANISVEYELCKHFTLGLIGERRWHMSEFMGYVSPTQVAPGGGVNWSAMATVRYKIGGANHIRNTSRAAYEAPYLPQSAVQDALNQRMANNEARMNQLQDQVNKANDNAIKANDQAAKANNELGQAKAELEKTKAEIERCCKSTLDPNGKTAQELRDLTFETNSARIKEAGELDQLVKILKENPKYNVMVNGFADGSGTDEINKPLSEQRATSVRSYLVSKGIKADRIKTTGQGSSNPIADNNTPEGREKNRRAEITILNN